MCPRDKTVTSGCLSIPVKEHRSIPKVLYIRLPLSRIKLWVPPPRGLVWRHAWRRNISDCVLTSNESASFEVSQLVNIDLPHWSILTLSPFPIQSRTRLFLTTHSHTHIRLLDTHTKDRKKREREKNKTNIMEEPIKIERTEDEYEESTMTETV